MLLKKSPDGSAVAAGQIAKPGGSNETRGHSLAQSPRIKHVAGPPREPLAAELMKLEDDLAMSRVRKTPKVFQSSGESISTTRHRRDLRVNLLPSIFRDPELDAPPPPGSGGFVAARCDADGGGLEADLGQFFKLYKSIVAQRAEDHEGLQHFLPREEPCLQLACDPDRLVASSCTTFRDLVSRCVERFRRPPESFVDVENPLLFKSIDQGQELQDLADILTLDIERHEATYKGTVKMPGFCSLQVASRVPLIAKNPLSTDESGRSGRCEAERLPGNGLYVMRLDFRPGEVRQLSMGLNSTAFRACALGTRMAALIDPERGTLSRVVNALRKRTSDAKGIVSVLSGLLRELPEALPAAPEPFLEAASDEKAKKDRLSALADKPRQTLSRLLEAIDSLAGIVAPVLPSVAHALDKVALICIREVDRVVSRSHENYECLLASWATIERERLFLLNKFGIAGGLDRQEGPPAGFELAKRIAKLEAELVKQQLAYTTLLKEKTQVEEELAEIKREQKRAKFSTTAARIGVVVNAHDNAAGDLPPRAKVARQSFGETPMTPLTSLSATPSSPLAVPMPGRPPSTSAVTPSSARALRSKPFPKKTFPVERSVQTETEPYFCDSPPFPEQLTFSQYGEIVKTAGRLYRILRKYEWNGMTCLFLPAKQRVEEKPDEPYTSPQTLADKVDKAVSRAGALQYLRDKVEQAHQKASITQLEEEMQHLRTSAKDGFEAWFRSVVKELAPQKGLPQPLTSEALWAMCTDLINMEGLRRRVRQLEDNLQSLLPLVDVVRGGDGPGGESHAFWPRVMKEVREQIRAPAPSALAAAVRRGSTAGAVTQADIDKAHLMNELTAIWFSIGRVEQDSEMLTRKPTQVVLQAAVKAFYLRKLGRAKLVEVAVVKLCRSVLDLSHSSAKILLFSVISGIEMPAAVKELLPQANYISEADPSFALDPLRLSNLPFDTAQVVAQLLRELKKKRSRRFSALDTRDYSKGPRRRSSAVKVDFTGDAQKLSEEDVQGDLALPLQLVLAAGKGVLASRSRATARFFELALLAFTDFCIEDRATSKGAAAAAVAEEHSMTTLAAEEEPATRAELERRKGEALFVSHLLKAYLVGTLANPEALPSWASSPSCLHAPTHDDRELALAHCLWAETSALWRSQDSRRVVLRSSLAVVMNASELARFLVQLEVLHLPEPIIAGALAVFAGYPRRPPQEVFFDAELFERLATSRHAEGGDQSAVCRESLVLWAALWALAAERFYEMELMGRLFTVFDGGSGVLPYSVFEELLESIFPVITKAECEDLFLAAADDPAGDMTRGVFVDLLTKLGITTDLNGLEEALNSKLK